MRRLLRSFFGQKNPSLPLFLFIYYFSLKWRTSDIRSKNAVRADTTQQKPHVPQLQCEQEFFQIEKQ